MSGNYTIGLIGGVGPWAGLDVHRKILEAASYEREQDCVSVMHLSYPGKYTDRTDYILGKTSVNPGHEFVRELQYLELAGVNSAAIVCNTAHAAPILQVIEQTMNDSPLRYVNIIRETQKALERDGIRKVGLLATLGTYTLDLYRNGFTGTVLYPSENDRQRVHNLIYNPLNGLKAHYPKHLELLYPELIAVARSLEQSGAEALILGCTELPLLEDIRNRVGIPVYDPNRILAQALVEQAAGNVLLPEPQYSFVSNL